MPEFDRSILYQFGKLNPLLQSFRFKVSTDRLLRTTNLFDYNQPYTRMAWVWMVSNLGAVSTFWSMNINNDNNNDWLRTQANGSTLQLRVTNGGVATNASGVTIPLETWCHLTSVRESVTSLKLYFATLTIPPFLTITNTGDVTARTAATRLEHGAVFTGNANPSDTRQAFIKEWPGYAMSPGEITEEWGSILPVRQAGQYSYYPGVAGVRFLYDFGILSRHWTGTVSMEDAPPLTLSKPKLFNTIFPFQLGNPWYYYAQM